RSPLFGPYLSRQSKTAFRDDIFLDLRRAAADDEPEREHEVERPDAAVAGAGRAAAERSIGAQDLERGARDIVVQLGGDELVDRRRDAGRVAPQRVGQLTVGVELHRLDAHGEIGEALADDRIVGRAPAVSRLALRQADELL